LINNIIIEAKGLTKVIHGGITAADNLKDK